MRPMTQQARRRFALLALVAMLVPVVLTLVQVLTGS
jgi:hypothetical protein